MKSITPIEQAGFNLVVDFRLDNDVVRRETISLKPFYTDSVVLKAVIGDDGFPVVDEEGNPVVSKEIVPDWHEPSDDIHSFLTNYGASLEAGIAAEQPPVLDMSLFGNPL